MMYRSKCRVFSTLLMVLFVIQVYNPQEYVILGPQSISVRMTYKVELENKSYLNLTMLINELNDYSYIVVCFGEPPLDIYGIALIKKGNFNLYAILGSQNKWFTLDHVIELGRWMNVSIALLKSKKAVIITINDDFIRYNTSIGRIEKFNIYITLANVGEEQAGYLYISKMKFTIDNKIMIDAKGEKLYHVLSNSTITGKGKVRLYPPKYNTTTTTLTTETTTPITTTTATTETETITTYMETSTTAIPENEWASTMLILFTITVIAIAVVFVLKVFYLRKVEQD